MADAERYTFSSLMSLLIASEKKLHELYEIAGNETTEDNLKAFLSDSGKKSLMRMNLMQRARVERVVEITLEPITGLQLADLTAGINNAIENGNASPLEKTLRLERAMAELYTRTSPKIMQISSDTAELLLELSHESIERQHELEQYVQSA